MGKSAFLKMLRARMFTLGGNSEIVNQIIKELEIKYDFEKNRGLSDSQVISHLGGVDYLANKYADTFGFTNKSYDNMGDSGSIFSRYDKLNKKANTINLDSIDINKTMKSIDLAETNKKQSGASFTKTGNISAPKNTDPKKKTGGGAISVIFKILAILAFILFKIIVDN